MKSGKNWKALLSNAVIIIICVFAIFLTVLLLVYKNKTNDSSDSSIVSSQSFHKEINNSKQVCLDYNNAVIRYNDEADKVNKLLEILAEDDIINDTNYLEKKQIKNITSDSTSLNDIEIDTINTDTDGINAKTKTLEKQYDEIYEIALKSYTERYSLLANEYNTLVKQTSVDFINDMPIQIELIKPDSNDNIEELRTKLCKLMTLYKIADQITSPTQELVISKLKTVSGITGFMAVSESNDPNNMLGKESGYSACIYFTIDSIDADLVKGNSIVEKGTDAGGAIEIYSDIESAKNRCAYLAQFDDTLLYSGSYSLVGTMVIRTSYKLSNEEQISLMNKIVISLTSID